MKTFFIFVLVIFALGSCTDTKNLMSQNKEQEKKIIELTERIKRIENVLEVRAASPTIGKKQ